MTDRYIPPHVVTDGIPREVITHCRCAACGIPLSGRCDVGTSLIDRVVVYRQIEVALCTECGPDYQGAASSWIGRKMRKWSAVPR